MATTIGPVTGELDPLLTQAAISMQMVQNNETLVQVSEHIALETLAVGIPAAIVEQLEADNSLLNEGNFFDLNASQRDFVEAIDGDTINLNESQKNLADAMENNMPDASVQQVFDATMQASQQIVHETIATAMVAAATSTVVAEVLNAVTAAELIPEAPQFPVEEETKQPLAYIITRHPVWIATGFPTVTEIDESIKHLDTLIEALQKVERQMYEEGLSPGFETKLSAKKWFAKNIGSVYETLPSVNSKKPAIPMPSPAAAVKYYTGIRNTWLERRRYVESMGQGNFCSCITEWAHAQGDVLEKLSNQSLEQDMVREASNCVTVRMQQPGCMRGEAWDRLYAPEFCPIPASVDHLYIPSTSIRIIGGRNDYISTFCCLALKAKRTIDVATCYMFPDDPAQRYILLNLLPFVARTRGVTVRLLCDMMPVESSILKSAIVPKANVVGEKKKGKGRSGIEPLSFLDSLPPEAPKYSERAQASPKSPMSFLEEVLHEAFLVPDNRFQVRWWCARDSQEKYRIKNHAKCAAFDAKCKGRALMGGSNIAPTLESGDSDLDMLVGRSEVVHKISETFDFLWDSMDASAVSCTEIISPEVHEDDDEEDSEDSVKPTKFPVQKWTDSSCRVALIRSEPCSAGSDVIFRHVLGAISSAEKTIYMCMGHSNKPMALAHALGEAVKRGVQVRLLVNSIYSCDLRVNQRDLFRSLKDLLTVAPGVEVWTTALRSHRNVKKMEEKKDDDDEEEEDSAPPFLHSKYTVVDGKWVAVGSWNVWTRSAFYEIEHELLIQSEAISQRLEAKFETEREATSVLLTTPEECDFWCPVGCSLCQSFGPFYA